MSELGWDRFYSGSLGEGTLVFGPITAIVFIGLVTLFCRISGYWLIGFVPIGPRVRRAFEMLPGAIAVSTAVPVAIEAGLPGIVAIFIAFFGRRLIDIEIVPIVAALGFIVASRAFGF